MLFDGWGYAHQNRNGTGKLATMDDYAIQEGIDDRWATRFGDLSIHEFATDPATNLAYISYYSGGFRAVRFDGRRDPARWPASSTRGPMARATTSGGWSSSRRPTASG